MCTTKVRGFFSSHNDRVVSRKLNSYSHDVDRKEKGDQNITSVEIRMINHCSSLFCVEVEIMKLTENICELVIQNLTILGFLLAD